MKKTLLLISAIIISLTGWAQLSRTEKKIVKYVDQNSAEAIERLKQTVRINSGTMNFEGVREVGSVYRKA
ncbi:MAG: M20 family peptidase, partial [Cyclobacteriaceae bacterium]